MNLMDMLSGESQRYQAESMNSVLDAVDAAPLASQTQPPNGVYYFPTVLTDLQKDLMELFIRVFGPQFIKEIHHKRLRTNINSLLDDEEYEGSAPGDSSTTASQDLPFSDQVDFLFEQLSIATNHPSLLVDHFLPKKLLLLEINERLISMSGKFQLFNRIIDALVEKFFWSVKFTEIPVYNMLVIADSVKELELIEGLIIGKPLYYENVSITKLYDDNRGIPPHFNQNTPQNDNLEKNSDSETEYKRRKRFLNKPQKHKPVVCLHLITSLQLYNNYTSILDPSVQFRMIVSFDVNLDSQCPSIELIRNQAQNVYENDGMKIPIIMPIPIFSIDHIQTLIPKPSTSSFNTNEMTNWKHQVLKTVIVNRYNLYDEGNDFFITNYGSNMDKFYQWFINWDSLRFPIDPAQFMEKFGGKLVMNFNDDKVIKRLDQFYLIDVNGTKFEDDFALDVYNYQTIKAKMAELLFNRITQIELAMAQLKEVLPKIKRDETARQLQYDKDEETVAESYLKLKRLNEDATFIEKKHMKVDNDISRLTEQKTDLSEKLSHLARLEHSEVDEKLKEQNALIEELTKDQGNLSTEYTKLSQENDTLRTQYQESSNEALQLTSQIARLKQKNDVIETKSTRPGIRTLPTLIKKEDLGTHEQTLARLRRENQFLTDYFSEKLEGLIGDRKAVMDQSGGSRNNRVSRASTPF